MSNEAKVDHLVAVVGAGPAGIYAAKELSDQGVHVALINRDIKPGGLAEYGIYPSKVKMKQALRKHFWEILKSPLIRYYGNVAVGLNGDLGLDDLRAMGFQAILVTVGAQGTKWLGLPGEDLSGVFHAKTLVYHYNSLPPYSQQEFDIGERAALIGVGNVMVDIARWLIRERKIERVTAVARRGPVEVKFTRKEFQTIIQNMDMDAFDQEIKRVSDRMLAVGQDPEEARAEILKALPRSAEPVSNSEFYLQFMSSPIRIIGDDQGQVIGLEMQDTELILRGDRTSARGLESSRTLDVDTVIFCIGDRVDAELGLPVEWNEYVKNPDPRFPVNGISYEAFNPLTGQTIEDVFLAGWAREASSGLVGTARKDGTAGAQAVLRYLETLDGVEMTDIEAFKEAMDRLDKPVVSVEKYNRLQWYEWAMADRQGDADFKFSSNEEMLEVMKLTLEREPVA
ncbi:MAG: FAD-dependent oxidoreductase [Chloroflexota bacterium]|nr:FAD-dependent oxidoreductase [Chloroflexota bacterium]